jgi:hypothetical protein
LKDLSCSLFQDIIPGTNSCGLTWLTTVGDRLFFYAINSYGSELWTLDSSIGSAVMICNLNQDAVGSFSSYSSGNSYPFYFSAKTLNGTKLFKLDDINKIWTGKGIEVVLNVTSKNILFIMLLSLLLRCLINYYKSYGFKKFIF